MFYYKDNRALIIIILNKVFKSENIRRLLFFIDLTRAVKQLSFSLVDDFCSVQHTKPLIQGVKPIPGGGQ